MASPILSPLTSFPSLTFQLYQDFSRPICLIHFPTGTLAPEQKKKKKTRGGNVDQEAILQH